MENLFFNYETISRDIRKNIMNMKNKSHPNQRSERLFSEEKCTLV